MWERTAEDNALDHLQKVGLLAPPGDVDKILQTVVNNLIITNNLQIIPDVRCRVLLTSPLESFTIGHTIVISRGLLDVLPDEGSLAMTLAHELSHIALGHRIDTRFAFNDRFFFPDQNTFQRMDFARNPAEEEAADHKAMELLENSPYKDKLANAGLFLKALETRAPELTSLIRPHLGNRMEEGKTIRMAALLSSAPQLEMQRIDQIAALPLGGRVKLDPWSNRLEMMKTRPVALLSPQEKMPFEVTPFFPYLTRLNPCPLKRHRRNDQHCSTTRNYESKSAFALETLKEMSMNRKLPMLALIAMISLSLAGCGGGGMALPFPPQAPGHTATGHPTGMWSTLPVTMPINPIHAALLHTGKILVVSGSGNCPPTLAGCPQGPQYSAGRGAAGLVHRRSPPCPIGWDMFCNGMSIMQDGRVLINGGTKGYGSLEVVGVQRRNSVYRSAQYFDFRSGHGVVC